MNTMKFFAVSVIVSSAFISAAFIASANPEPKMIIILDEMMINPASENDSNMMVEPTIMLPEMVIQS